MLTIPKGKIACVPLFDPDKTADGLLYIPETAKERCDQGIVKYVGADVKDVSIGDHVLFSGYTGTLISLEGEGLLIIMPSDYVTAVIHPPDDIDIPGLYFYDPSDKSYFVATYEQAMTLIARGIEGSKWYNEANDAAMRKGKKGFVKAEMPKPKDYTWK